MRQTILIAHLTIKCWLKQPLPLLAMMLFPLLMLSVAYLGLKPLMEQKQWVKPFAAAIVDEDSTFETKLLMKQYEESEELKGVLSFIKTDADEASERLAKNEIAGIVIIPKGFTKGIRVGKNIPVTVIGNPERPFQSALLQQVMVSNANLISAAQSGANTAFHYLRKLGLSSDEFAAYREPIITGFTLHAMNRNSIYETSRLDAFGGLTPIHFYSLSGLLILVMIGGLFTMSLMSRQEQATLRDRLFVHGIRPPALFFGNVVSAFFLLVVQSVILIGLLMILTEKWSMMAAGILLAYCLAVSSLFALCHEFFQQNGTKWGAGITLFSGMTAVSGTVVPLSYLPAIWQSLSAFNVMHLAHVGLVEALFMNAAPTVSILMLVLFSSTAWGLGLLIITMKKRLLWSGRLPLHA
jgi:ABC-2 type transport system permease protein